jgi:hypothetical protein
MELAEIGKKRALFIPTPGQTEQEYLSWYYEKKNWFHSVNQYDFNLLKDVRVSREYSGFPSMPATAENVERLYRDVFAEVLE